MKKKIEFDEQCSACNGTGIYVGLDERDGVGVVCYRCEGKGWKSTTINYDSVESYERKKREDVLVVLQANPGICVGNNEEEGLKIKEDYGGIAYKDWYKGGEFPAGSEMRKFTCPAWWYQSVDYDKKPNWDECTYGAFYKCKHFETKEKCWERWDKEFS